MKKLICILLTLALATTLAACGSSKPDEAQTPVSDTVFKYNGKEIVMGANAEEVVKALGKPTSLTEQPSCLDANIKDKTYGYGGFFFTTMPGAEGEDLIANLWFADDTVFTTKGVNIGAPEAKVKSAYPDAYVCSPTYIIEDEGASLMIVVQGGKVESITYTGTSVACPVC